MTTATLLVELLTEELPPKALSKLGEVFSAQIHTGLAARKLTTAGDAYQWFATPRRLAIQVPGVLAVAPDAKVTEKIMPVAVALDAAGQPTQALLKKLEAKGIPTSEIAKFEKRMDGKAEALFYEATVKGVALDDVLAGIVADALKKLPIPKLMRWGDSDHQFVRPVHGLVQLHGSRVVPGEVLGLKSRAITLGHRFLSSGEIAIGNADAYADLLKTQGKVVVSFAERKSIIAAQLDAKAAELKATINPSEGLLDEVSSLVEWPVVYVGEFEAEFLDVPQECLILTMQQNQKYFPLLDAGKKLLNKFLIVSNMQVDDPKHIVGGNARVVRPRLSDARFFFNQDRKATLASRLDKLANVVYHNKIGSVLQRVERLEALAQKIAVRLGANASLAARGARLAKADLVTDMVGEFPELQGIMGRYYALHDGEDAQVADAIQSHYQPRFAGDALPQGPVACAAALADKLDAMTGFFGIGQVPTGDKDPFGLRRAALGVLRILMETPLPLDLADLIADAQAGFAAGVLTQPVAEPLLDFMLDRLRGLLKDAGYAQDVIDAVLSQRPTRIDLVPAKLSAVRDFLQLPEALALAAANKRIGNILKKAEGATPAPVSDLLSEDAEKALFARVEAIAPVVAAHVAAGSYADALKVLATVRAEVDHFFDKVMVNVDDAAVRANRLGLLKALFDQLNAVADISKLGV
ncbi:glycine--tRNA ligase subunit beta [Propionivibrio dicarboxylicus]|uniref:Glycine--tRNA ligase beta subunit n=1 Tax=Propionivibrio dicarboxylicus TaxID=83767 RepID=A0A1G8KC94_9RHOO|nr:glycine--tRNA ligase subunit beta [Propionivibrio dicarboxylicus]SDI41031.1 glycyl-tRNA synthetase beta chain [Propionivibrio dicarboxylicus]